MANYRDAYDLFACSGILFNHEWPLRPERFVTRKVVAAACRIASGSGERLQLGNLAVCRDWGWAPEYVDAMWRMLQRDAADDYVIATGEPYGLEDFVRLAFEAVDLDWREHTEVSPGLLRASDIRTSAGNAGKARQRLGWEATYRAPDVVRMMVAAERAGPDALDWLKAPG